MNNANNTALNILSLNLGDKVIVSGKRPMVVDFIDANGTVVHVGLKGSRGGITLLQGVKGERVQSIKGFGSMNPVSSWLASSAFVCEAI